MGIWLLVSLASVHYTSRLTLHLCPWQKSPRKPQYLAQGRPSGPKPLTSSLISAARPLWFPVLPNLDLIPAEALRVPLKAGGKADWTLHCFS